MQAVQSPRSPFLRFLIDQSVHQNGQVGQINMPAALAWELFEEGLQKAERTAEAGRDRDGQSLFATALRCSLERHNRKQKSVQRPLKKDVHLLEAFEAVTMCLGFGQGNHGGGASHVSRPIFGTLPRQGHFGATHGHVWQARLTTTAFPGPSGRLDQVHKTSQNSFFRVEWLRA